MWCNVSRIYRSCAKIPLPDWKRIPCHHQPGVNQVWKAAAKALHIPEPPWEEEQYFKSVANYLSIQQWCDSILHRTHPGSVPLTNSLFHSLRIRNVWLCQEKGNITLKLFLHHSTGHKFMFGHTFGQLSKDALEQSRNEGILVSWNSDSR